MTDRIIVIASPLEAGHVERIRAVEGYTVLHEPGLVPAPRYVADHKGVHPRLQDADRARWLGMLAEAEVLFDFDWMEPSRLQSNAPRLRWIQATSSGIGQVIERLGVDPSGLTFTTAAGVHAVPLAEFALTGILHVVKGLPYLRAEQRARRWERYTSRQLRGLRATVVGLGTVGRETVALLAASGLRVTAVGRDGRVLDAPGAERTVGMSQLDAVLAETDALVLCVPQTPETAGLLSAERIALLPEGAALVNIARGGVVDESAMLAALESGRLGGAALDVFSAEPLPEDSPFWDRDDVIVSPHSASTVVQENERITDIFIENLHAYRDGKPLRNVYDASRGY